MSVSISHIIEQNRLAIRYALLHRRGNQVTPAMVQELEKYQGFGAVKQVLYGPDSEESWLKQGASTNDMQYYRQIHQLYNTIGIHFSDEQYKDVCESIRSSALSAFYTPPIIPEAIYKALSQNGISPSHMLEPSAGAGIFIKKAIEHFPTLVSITAVEKDIISGYVLKAISSSWPVKSQVHIIGFEEVNVAATPYHDLIISNTPFGAYGVFDRNFPRGILTNKIHNYFFVKGLDHLPDGGMLAFITTAGFLNSPGNEDARQYLFKSADFVSVAVLPDNLMESAGVLASMHLLVVQKNSNKASLTDEELLLSTSLIRSNENGEFHYNAYLDRHPNVVLGDRQVASHNQYGKPSAGNFQDGDMAIMAGKLTELLSADLKERFQLATFKAIHQVAPKPATDQKLIYLPPPPAVATAASSTQLGMFDADFAGQSDLAQPYLNKNDRSLVDARTASIAAKLSTTDRPEHDSIVLLKAKTLTKNLYLYKLYSNLGGISVSDKWQSGSQLLKSLETLKKKLEAYPNTFIYNGDRSLEHNFGLNATEGLSKPSVPYYHQYGKVEPNYKNGMLVEHHGKIGHLSKVEHETNTAEFSPLFTTAEDEKKLRAYIDLRDSYHFIYRNEAELQLPMDDSRHRLNSIYQRFVDQYGVFNSDDNKRLVLNDAFGFEMLSSLEVRTSDGFVRSDIFREPVSIRKAALLDYYNAADTLPVCLNQRGRVDLKYMSSLCGLDPELVREALGDKVYFDPAKKAFVTSEEYLSGNVVEKMERVTDALKGNPGDSELQRSLQAITLVQPESVPFEILDFNLGERWIPRQYYDQYASSVFDVETTVHYFESMDTFKVVPSSRNGKILEEYAVRTRDGEVMYGSTTFEHALENTYPHFTYKDISDRRIPDAEANALAFQKIETIREGFKTWLNLQSVEVKLDMETRYNRIYNSVVLRNYDGSHLNFIDLDLNALGYPEIRPIQRDAVWRVMSQEGGVIDYDTGLGKTLIAAMASHEMARLKLSTKNLILGLKSNITAIAQEYRSAYPNAKILFAGKDDFTPKERQRMLFEIKNGNWEAVIITHDQFLKLDQSLDIQQKILRHELRMVSKDLSTVTELGGDISKKMLKGLERRKDNLSGRLKYTMERIKSRTDKDIFFDDLNIGHIFLDESHHFKNLGFTTRHNRVAGLGNPDGSQKAWSLLMALRTLQESKGKDLQATFLTATPLSNSLTELYLIFKYLRPRELARQQLENFDGWAAVYAKQSSEFEISVTGAIKSKARYRHFIKIPELLKTYNEIAEHKTAEQAGIALPTIEEKLIDIQPTPDQAEFIKKLVVFAETGNASQLRLLRGATGDQDAARMLLATTYAQKMSLDMRLINELLYDEHPGNKINIAATNIAAIYRETSPDRGVQLVFSDLGVPKPDQFNVYDELKRVLVEVHGLPAKEISFIHDWSDKSKDKNKKAVNEGHIRVLIGSTYKAGTGNNFQRRLIATHHLDIPYRPTDLRQRTGRMRRPGNMIAAKYGNKVRSFIYAVVGSLDAFKFNLLKLKDEFLYQTRASNISVRSFDEGVMDAEGTINYAAYVAVLSGNTDLLEKSKVERQIMMLQVYKAAQSREAANARFELVYLKKNLEAEVSACQKLVTDKECFDSAVRFDSENNRVNQVVIPIASKDPEEIGKYFLQQIYDASIIKGQEREIGTLYGFSMVAIGGNEGKIDTPPNRLFAKSPHTGLKYSVTNGIPNFSNLKLAARYFLFALDRLTDLISQHQQRIDKGNDRAAVLSQMVDRPFEKEPELSALRTQHAALVVKLAQQAEAEQAQQQTTLSETSSLTPPSNLVEQPVPEPALVGVSTHHPSLSSLQLSKRVTIRPTGTAGPGIS
ncbi:DNA methylase [Chitinophaga arvensicola]|uniref:Helicase ATP-binding domain-containing protein n=1 Tax=Chitinophaga arvensicola TaxID=29529 RepID=A0A1I0PNQ6_9BACT|nr:DNA methylase [Chitinophaga arvensicola]SEW16054.1 hypothetical protein SAMN04488122_0889 [Chitinophaga arvensicola]